MGLQLQLQEVVHQVLLQEVDHQIQVYFNSLFCVFFFFFYFVEFIKIKETFSEILKKEGLKDVDIVLMRHQQRGRSLFTSKDKFFFLFFSNFFFLSFNILNFLKWIKIINIFLI